MSFSLCSIAVPHFELNVSMYALMLALGGFAGIIVCILRAPTKDALGVGKLKVFLCTLYAAAFGLVGAKLFFVVGNLKSVLDGSVHIYTLLLSGQMFYGGFWGGLLGVLLFSKLVKTRPVLFFDALAVGLALTQSIGRIGCFFAGCCHGAQTDGAFSIVYSQSAAPDTPLNTPLVPVQLIESAFCLLIFVILMLYGAQKSAGKNRGVKIRRDGNAFVLYCVLYAVFRFIVEFWRGDPVRGFVGALSWSQFIGVLILIGVGIYLTVRNILRRKKIGLEFSQNFLENF